jgi:hypothetical protein
LIDVWDVWFLQNKLDAKVAREVVQKKFASASPSFRLAVRGGMIGPVMEPRNE